MAGFDIKIGKIADNNTILIRHVTDYEQAKEILMKCGNVKKSVVYIHTKSLSQN